jgi:hypothetical protein
LNIGKIRSTDGKAHSKEKGKRKEEVGTHNKDHVKKGKGSGNEQNL